MDATLQLQIEAYKSRLASLIRRGLDLRAVLVSNPSDAFTVTATRVWQRDCGLIINELSGGSKAHWLARSFSQSFLFRSEDGQALEQVPPEQIIDRLLGVLHQAGNSLFKVEQVSVSSASAQASPRRFDFVHNQELRPVLEQSYNSSRIALEQDRYDEALRNFCGILEAIVTDALEHKGLPSLIASGAPAGKISDWTLETRLAVAERAGLVRGGWVRLPVLALSYRNESGIPTHISEQDARRTNQVLNVVMRDLDPGR